MIFLCLYNIIVQSSIAYLLRSTITEMALSGLHKKPKLITVIRYLSGGTISSQVIVTVIATLGAVVSGTILGWSSPAQDMFKNDHEFPFPVTSKDVQTFISMFGIGALMGMVPVGYACSLFGRRASMILFECIVLVGWVMLVLPTSVWMLIAARVLQGVGVGAMCAIIPSYISEIAESRFRGRLGTIFQLFLVTGILFSFTLGAFITYPPFCITSAIWVVLHILGTLCIPESPYYLMSKNDPDRAAHSLQILRDSSDTTKELEAIKSFIEQQQSRNYTLSQVLADKANRRALLISIGCMFFQQMCGINVVIFYMTDIFDSTGSHLNPHTCSITVGVVQFIMALVSFSTVDKYGRKLLLVISALMMSVCYMGICIFHIVKYENQELSTKISWLPLVCIAVYIASYSIGYGPLPWIMMGEIYSSEVKHIGTSLTTSANWMLMFVVTYVFNELILFIGQAGCYLTFSIFCLMAATFAGIVVPETKNKTLAEIQLKLNGKQATSVATTKTATPSPQANYI